MTIEPSDRLREHNVIVRFLQLIRFSHTIFALPFAFGALLVAADGWPTLRTLSLVLLCMILARTAAMLFNRLSDWSIDQRNPRTHYRHLLVNKSVLWICLIISAVGFLWASAAINTATGYLAPVALLIIFFYSLTKRFTSATHFFLGLALATAPAGAWIAQTGGLELAPLILGAGVVCWVAGFDIIYATQDVDFDQREGLHSIVVRLGVSRSLQLANWLHLVMFISLILFGVRTHLGPVYYAAMPLVAAALFYEHRSARKLDLGGVNRAFFQSNAIVSAIFLIAIALDRCL